MGWEKDYEHWRDSGHTWGPGIDNVREPTDAEIEEAAAQRKAYEERVAGLRVGPSTAACQASTKLESIRPSDSDIRTGVAPYDWQDKYSKAKLGLAQEIAQSMGYELKLRDWKDRDENKFMVSVEFYGYIPERGGNIHDFSVSNIKSIEDCLQLVADFSELGYWPTTWYQKNHISLKNTGELRLEMRGWGFPLEKESKPGLDERIQSASDRASKPEPGSGKGKDVEPAI